MPQNKTIFDNKGVDKYLYRQLVARQTKEEKEHMLRNPLAKLNDCKEITFQLLKNIGTQEYMSLKDNACLWQ